MFRYNHFIIKLLISCVSLFSLFYSLGDFHWFLSDSEFPQVSRTLLSILADLNNAVVWMVLIIIIIIIIIKIMNVCNQNYVTTDVTLPVVIFVSFSLIILFFI